MERGTIAEVTITLSVGKSHYNYRGVTEPQHSCKEPRMLKPGDKLKVEKVTPSPTKDVLVKGPCGCNFLLYELVTVT